MTDPSSGPDRRDADRFRTGGAPPVRGAWATPARSSRLRDASRGASADLYWLAQGAYRTLSRVLAGRVAAPGAASIDPMTADPTAWARALPIRVVRRGLVTAVRPALRTQLRVETFGELPAGGSMLLVANHASHLDTAVVVDGLPAAVRDRLVVAASAGYFFDAWWRTVPSALVFDTAPLPASGVEPVASLLAGGWNVLIFGEPSRSEDGWVHDFAEQVGEIALAAARDGVPVVPVGIRGTFAALPRGRWWIRSGRPRVSVRFGAPMRVDRVGDATAAADRMTAAVRMLIAEDTATWWGVLRGRAPEIRPDPAAARWRRIWAQTDAMAKGRPPGGRARRIWR